MICTQPGCDVRIRENCKWVCQAEITVPLPALAALGEHIWAGDRDQRFTASLDTLLGGIQTARRRNRRQPRR
jgi:hypothetical protein